MEKYRYIIRGFLITMLLLIHSAHTTGAEKPVRYYKAGEVGAFSVDIEIPANIDMLQNEDMPLARHWREVTREAFLEALLEGFRVEEFFLPEKKCQSSGTYVLLRKRKSR